MNQRISFIKKFILIFFSVLVSIIGSYGQSWEKINQIDGRIFTMYQNDDIAYVCAWDNLYVADNLSSDFNEVLDGITWRVFREYDGQLYIGGHGQWAYDNFVKTPLDEYAPVSECVHPNGPDRVSMLDMQIHNDLFYFGTIDDGIQYRSPDDCNFIDISPPQLKTTADNSVLRFTNSGALILGTYNGDLYFTGDQVNWSEVGSGFGPINDILEFKGNYYMGATRFRRSDGENLSQWSTIEFEWAGDMQIYNDELYVARRTGVYSSADGFIWTKQTDGLGELDNDAVFHVSGSRLFIGARDGSIYRLKSTTSTEEEDVAVDFNLSPNPATTVLNIQVEKHEIIGYSIYNIQGQLMMQRIQLPSPECSIDIHSLQSSVYAIQIKTNTATHTKQFVVIK